MGTGGKIEAVLTCQGDIDDPDFPHRCQAIFDKLSKVLDNRELDVTKCEPWNSVKVTFNIPPEAAAKLARLAEAGDQVLRELGILSIQVEGGQVISMTMMEEDSDSDSEVSTSAKSSPAKVSTHNSIVSNKEEKVTVKQEPLLSAPADKPSLKGPPSRPGQSGVRPGSSRDAGSELLLKSLPAAGAGSPAKSSEQSALSPFSGTAPQLGKEGLLATFMSSRAAGKSDLMNSKDSDEPASKKARKQETIKSSDNSLSSGYNFSKLSGSGFTILPVTQANAANITSRSLSSGSQFSSNLDSRSLNPVSGSSVKLANLPGVSLTSVNRSNYQSNSLSSRPGSLMPPPTSSVTLSPVPRTNNVNSLNDRTTHNSSERLSESNSDKKPSPVSNIEPAKLSLHSPKVSTNNKQQPLLINPVTGQFEIGPAESVPAAASEAASGKSKRDPAIASEPPDGDKASGTGSSTTSGTPSTASVTPSSTASGTTSTTSGTASSIESATASSTASDTATITTASGAATNTTSGTALSTASGTILSTASDQKSSLPKLDPPPGESSSPGGSSTSGEPSLKLKLKVSLPSNSSKGVKESGIQSAKIQGKAPEPSEPKLPKLKIKLKDKSVELENDQSPDGNALNCVGGSSEGEDEGSVQLDLKTRVRIKPLPEKIRLLEEGSAKQEAIAGHLSSINQSINHISVDTDKKKKLSLKEKKGGKDRLAVWTESLSKHSQRQDSATKETKSWPELLENRLFSQGNNALPSHSNMAFNKTEVLKNQTDKGDEKSSDNSEDHHLNWAGPGREGAEPGPGHTLPLSPHLGNQPSKPPDLPEKDSELVDKPEAGKEPGPANVLDILEERRPLGDPISPLGTQGGHPNDNGAQQGEDSGIESMDTLSEKSPNQGESPFHAVMNDTSDERRVPTYSSSMGPVSGKVSPPVSDSGSTDSLVNSTPPDKSPSTGTTSTTKHQNQEPGSSKPDSKDSDTASSSEPTPPVTREPSGSPNSTSQSSNSSNPTQNCDSNQHLKQAKPSSDISKVTKNPADQPNSASQSNALTNSSISLVASTSSENISISQSDLSSADNIPEQNGRGDKDADLIRSCDGADDHKCPGDLIETNCPPSEKQPSELTNCMHDYVNGKTVDTNNHITESSSNNSNSECNIINVKNGENSSPASPAALKAAMRRVSADQVVEGPPGLLTLTRVNNQTTVSLPVSSVSLSTRAPGLLVRNQLPIRPGAKMVPVKLVSVPGGGGRMVRVSPVKGGEIVATSGVSSGLPPRTVVLKSSLFKSISSSEVTAVGLGGGTTSLVRYPAPAAIGRNQTTVLDAPTLIRNPEPLTSTSKNCDNLSFSPVEEPSSASASIAGETPSQTSVSQPSISSPASQPPSAEPPAKAAVNGVADPEASLRPSNATESQEEALNITSDAPISINKPETKSMLTNGDINDSVGTESKRKVRNGKKASGESVVDDGGSLLRPLIGKEDVVDIPSPVSLSPIPPGGGKRTRRDTGSSAQSDKSDLSIQSSHSAIEPAAKRVKEDGKRRGSTSPGLRENSRSLDKKKGEEKVDTKADNSKKKVVGKAAEKKVAGPVTNGPKAGKPKPEVKKVGRSVGQTVAKPNQTSVKPLAAKPGKLEARKVAGAAATTTPVSTGATSKIATAGASKVAVVNVAATKAAASKPDLAGRRVSTRGKKPEEVVVTGEKKKKR